MKCSWEKREIKGATRETTSVLTSLLERTKEKVEAQRHDDETAELRIMVVSGQNTLTTGCASER